RLASTIAPATGTRHRPVRRDERRQIAGTIHAVDLGKRNLRVLWRARSTESWLRVAATAVVQIHPRSKAVGDRLGFHERHLAQVEKLQLSRGQIREGISSAGSSAHARIFGQQ